MSKTLDHWVTYRDIPDEAVRDIGAEESATHWWAAAIERSDAEIRRIIRESSSPTPDTFKSDKALANG